MTGHRLGPCPRGPGRRYAVCCGPLHRGQRHARTAEALMRSRYSAHVLRLEPYLLATWHPDTRPGALNLQRDTARWLGLQIHRTVGGGAHDDAGQVDFTARYRQHGEDDLHTEHSRFVRLDGRWVYLDTDGARPARPVPPSPRPPPRARLPACARCSLFRSWCSSC